MARIFYKENILYVKEASHREHYNLHYIQVKPIPNTPVEWQFFNMKFGFGGIAGETLELFNNCYLKPNGNIKYKK